MTAPDERQAGLREALEEIRETAEYLADRGDEIDRVGRVAIPKRIARLATGALAALAAQVPAQEERLDVERLLDGIRDEVREAVEEGDRQDCSSSDCIADAVYDIVRVRLRALGDESKEEGAG